MMRIQSRAWLAACAAALLLSACERPPVQMVQHGYRGTGMAQVYNPRTLAEQAPANAAPADAPPVPPGGPGAGLVFKNVKVLTDLNVAEFTRLMVDMTAWVAPAQGCPYCHTPGADFSDDGLYTKTVARRMLQMTRHVNSDWKTHVAGTGVTCYTCHRGQPVPANVWFVAPPDGHDAAAVGGKAGQNSPAMEVALASLPYDPFTPFLLQPNDIRVVGLTPLPTDNRKSTKQAEWTYGLMMHMSQALGVNCTFCHNTRSFAEWNTSSPQRATAWYGLRMVRDLNTAYLQPLAGVFPANRLGPTGDVPKLNCATCHQGAFKPLYGAGVLANHPELAGVRAAVAPAEPASALAAAKEAVLLFGVGSADLSSDAAMALEPLIAALKSDATARITISGYHSAAGSLASNQDLAKRRAFAVREALKSAGIAEDRVLLQKPQAAEANLSGEDPQARRVEVAVR